MPFTFSSLYPPKSHIRPVPSGLYDKFWTDTDANIVSSSLDTLFTATNALSSSLASIGALENDIVNVKAKGALGDGSTDDSTSIQAAINSLPASGGIVYFPPGVYRVGTTLTLPNASVIFRGAGMGTSVLKVSGSNVILIYSSLASGGDFVIEDMGLESGAAGYAMWLNAAIRSTHINRCRFWNCAIGVALVGGGNFYVDQSVFQGPGNNTGIGVLINTGVRDVNVSRTVFRGLYDNIRGDSSTYGGIIEGVHIDSCYMDGEWWNAPYQYTNEGGTVTYTSSSLADSTATWPALPNQTVIRSMKVACSGTAGFDESLVVVDAAAPFVSSNVAQGHMIRVGSKVAIVLRVQSSSTLWVEEWLNEADHTQAAAPGGGSSYVIYQPILGIVDSNTSSSITLQDGWFDRNGARSTPAAGTRYEILHAHGNYPIHFDNNSLKIKVTNNTILRGWSDQVSMGGAFHLIEGNWIEDGSDTGITTEPTGTHHIRIANNHIHRQGIEGIAHLADDSYIGHNIITETQHKLAAGFAGGIYDGLIAGIDVQNGSRNLLESNIISRGPALCLNGIVLSTDGGTNDGNVLRGNVSTDAAVWDLRVDGSSTNVILEESNNFKTRSILGRVRHLINPHEFNVQLYGAIGDDIADDTVAIEAARDAASAWGDGAVVFFPLPKVAYRTTREIVFGQKFVDVADVKYSATLTGTYSAIYTPAPSFNLTAYNAVQQITTPIVHLIGEGNVPIHGDFSGSGTGSEASIFYYGIGGSSARRALLNTQIKNFIFYGQNEMVSGVLNSISGSNTPMSGNQVGLCVPGGAVLCSNLQFRGLKRPVAFTDNYHSRFEQIKTYHCGAGHFVHMNESEIDGLAGFGNPEAQIITGQGYSARGLGTEDCAQDFKFYDTDMAQIELRYLENTSAGDTAYGVEFGDPSMPSKANQVNRTNVEHAHISRTGGNAMNITSADVTFEQLDFLTGIHYNNALSKINYPARQFGRQYFMNLESSHTIALPISLPDTNYRVYLSVFRGGGTPAAASYHVHQENKTTSSFDLVLEAAPGSGTHVQVDWHVIHGEN